MDWVTAAVDLIVRAGSGLSEMIDRCGKGCLHHRRVYRVKNSNNMKDMRVLTTADEVKESPRGLTKYYSRRVKRRLKLNSARGRTSAGERLRCCRLP